MKYKNFQANITTNKNRVTTFLKSKDVVTFLVFLVLAFLLWLMHGTSSRSKLKCNIEIAYIGIPEEVEFINELPKTISVTIKDEGKFLWNYYINGFDAVRVDLTDKFIYASDGTLNIDYRESISRIELHLESSTDIVEISPNFYLGEYSRLQSKEVPIYLKTPFKFAEHMVLKDSISISHKTIKISGKQELIDSITCVYIKPIDVVINKSVSLSAPLEIAEGINVRDSVVNIDISTEMSTEKTLQLPLRMVNVPDEIVLHTFPSTVQANFSIGLSRYKLVDENDFEIVFDFNDILSSETDEIKTNTLRINKIPSDIYNLRLSPREVEYIIEK